MEPAVGFRVLAVAVAELVHVAGGLVFLGGRAGKAVIVHEIVAGVVGRVDVDHLDLAHVGTL